MRELRFRVWNIADKCWDNPNILEVWNDSGKLEPYKYIKSGKLDPIYNPKENYVIQQFTGLKDLKGKDIYEGDLVLYHVKMFGESENIPLVVEFNNGSYEAMFPKELDGLSFPMWFDSALFNCEIVGNIFENPELLKTK